MSHFRAECPHGVVYAQCRCPAADKAVRPVPCNWNDDFHRTLSRAFPDYKPRHAAMEDE